MTYDSRWWVVMGAWCLVVAVLLVWLYRAVKKSDERAAQDAAVERDALIDEIRGELKEKSAVYGLPKGTEQGFSDRARKAESLGFLEDPPRRAS